jgi:hypothetical protein
MKYTVFIFTLLYLCLVFSRSAAASESFGFQLEACNSGLAAKSPVEEMLGQNVTVVVGSESIESIVAASGTSYKLVTEKETEVEVVDGRLSYQSRAIDDSTFELNVTKSHQALTRDFARQSESHALNIRIDENQLVVEWTELDSDWDNFSSCTFKAAVVTAKN